MKMKWYRILAIALFTIFLTACNIQTVEQYEKMEEQEHSIAEEKQQLEEAKSTEIKEDDEVKEVEKVEEVEEVVEEESEKQKEPEQTKVEQPVEKKADKATEKSTEKPVEKAADKEPTKQPAKQPEKPKTSEQPKQQVTPKETDAKKRYVTIAIRVDSILKHWDLLDPALQSEKYVPKNGAILKTTKYELLSDKDTVWDVLQRATKEHKIQMEYQGANENIYNSVYVEGINHLYEFSAGPLSGWMYKVNGVYPNYGCSQYKLADGDVIEWHYTVDLGRDLGHYWDGES